MTDLVEMKNAFQDALKRGDEKLRDMGERVEYCEKTVMHLEAKGKRPGFGGGSAGMEWKSADISDFLRKNTMPSGVETKDLTGC